MLVRDLINALSHLPEDADVLNGMVETIIDVEHNAESNDVYLLSQEDKDES